MSHEAHENRMEFSVSQSRSMYFADFLFRVLPTRSGFWNGPGNGCQHRIKQRRKTQKTLTTGLEPTGRTTRHEAEEITGIL